jgi:hypothetical protein
MVRAGIWLNLISVIMIVAVVNLLLVPVFSG